MENETILKKLLGLIPNEEEQPEKFETEDILDNVDINDFTPDGIVMGDQLVDDQSVNTQTNIAVITDDDTSTNDANATDNVNVQVDDVQISKQQQGQEEKKDGENKISEELPVHTHIVLPPIATTMQSREKKKRMKEQQKEAKTIKHTVEILSSLLSEIDIDNFATPIDKLGQLVNDVGEQMKASEDATYVCVEKEYKKKTT
ncbi:uncharacterized protein LOC131858541 [Cryptomeria japonica]|uniref:uncharacterized protein LOC131858541 n=1 Tax=Cryptomeria japonica TaxID=3369 RepID=UPI0027DA5E7E|nr:uncharacterized protein LOC131858541 [Cryptomeria japonica]